MINCLFEFASVSIDLDDSTYLKGALYHPLEPHRGMAITNMLWVLTY